MINENEIRVGNWVNVPHGNVCIDKFLDNGVHFTDGCGGTFQSLYPIAITPEIKTEFSIIFYDHGVHFDEASGMKFFKFYINSFDLKSKNKILYLHDLQNFFKDRTGKDLIVQDAAVENLKYYRYLNKPDEEILEMVEKCREETLKHDYKRHLWVALKEAYGFGEKMSSKEDIPYILEWALRLKSLMNEGKETTHVNRTFKERMLRIIQYRTKAIKEYFRWRWIVIAHKYLKPRR